MRPNVFSRSFLAATICLACLLSAEGQSTGKKITARPVSWNSYFNTLQLSSKWSVTSDVSERFFLDNGNQFQFFLRSMANYNLGQNWSAGAGFAYIKARTFDPASTSTLGVPELRPYQELSYRQKLDKITLSHRYRIEERYIRKTASDKLIDGYNFNFRFRYQLALDYNLYKSKDNTKSLNFRAADEIMINAGKNIVNNMFDQNRITVGFNYQPLKNLNLQLDYMYAFQQKSSGNQFNHADIIRLQIFQRIKLYK